MASNMAMNQRVQKILLELMRERHSLYAGFTDVELKSILKSHAGDVSACHATIQGLQDADGGTGDVAALYRARHGLDRGDDTGDGDGRGEAADAAGFPGPGAYAAGEAGAGDRGAKRYRPDGAEDDNGGGEPSKKKRHRPSRDRARERIERRVPLTREGVDSLDWNEACEYAKSMGVSKKSHTTRDAYRDACRSWFDGRERAVFVPARAPNAPRQRWQRADDVPALFLEAGAGWNTSGPFVGHWITQLVLGDESQVASFSVGKVVGYLSAAESDYVDDAGAAAALWCVAYVSGQHAGDIADLEEWELLECAPSPSRPDATIEWGVAVASPQLRDAVLRQSNEAAIAAFPAAERGRFGALFVDRNNWPCVVLDPRVLGATAAVAAFAANRPPVYDLVLYVGERPYWAFGIERRDDLRPFTPGLSPKKLGASRFDDFRKASAAAAGLSGLANAARLDAALAADGIPRADGAARIFEDAAARELAADWIRSGQRPYEQERRTRKRASAWSASRARRPPASDEAEPHDLVCGIFRVDGELGGMEHAGGDPAQLEARERTLRLRLRSRCESSPPAAFAWSPAPSPASSEPSSSEGPPPPAFAWSPAPPSSPASPARSPPSSPRLPSIGAPLAASSFVCARQFAVVYVSARFFKPADIFVYCVDINEPFHFILDRVAMEYAILPGEPFLRSDWRLLFDGDPLSEHETPADLLHETPADLLPDTERLCLMFGALSLCDSAAPFRRGLPASLFSSNNIRSLRVEARLFPLLV